MHPKLDQLKPLRYMYAQQQKQAEKLKSREMKEKVEG